MTLYLILGFFKPFRDNGTKSRPLSPSWCMVDNNSKSSPNHDSILTTAIQKVLNNINEPPFISD